MTISSKNPATGETFAVYETHSADAIEEALKTAAETFPRFAATPLTDRAERMNRAATILEERKEEYGRLITLEMGKPLKAAIAEVAKCATVCRHYAENAAGYLSEEEISTGASRSYVVFQPLGVILAVMPWNFPFWQVFRFAAPALMAGNAGLLKHASNVPGSALAIENVFRDAGFEKGAFQTLLVGSDAVASILDDDRVSAATLTGSEPAGSDVASRAGKKIKKTVLELGGSDPFIVTSSADLERAVETAVKARIINNGQSCIAAKRFIAVGEIADSFEQAFTQRMKSLIVGDPLEDATDIGPLATTKIADDLEKQVQASIAQGARLLTGGRRLSELGLNFYEPTVLADIPLSAPAYAEELFGPVASLFRVRTVDEAIDLANSTEFGLGASAWTNDPAERQRFIDGIQAGQVFINAMVASDPRLPFGGIKRSGYGRELGQYGIREFVNIKTVWIA